MISPTFLIITLQKVVSMYKKMFLLCLIPLLTQATEVEEVHLNFSDGQVNSENLEYYKPTMSNKTFLLTSLATTCFGFLSGYGAYALLDTSKVTNLYALTIIPLLAGSLIGSFTGLITYNYQPEAKFETARNTLFAATNDKALTELISDQSNLLKNIDRAYVKDSVPRFKAHKNFVLCYTRVERAIESLNTIIKESDNEELVAYAKNYLPILNTYKEHLARSMETIKADPSWLAETACHEKILSNELTALLILAIARLSLELYQRNYYPVYRPYYYY